MSMYYSPDLCHESTLKNREPLLAYNENEDYTLWRESVKVKLAELLGDMPEKTDLDIKIEFQTEFDDFTETRFSFQSEYLVRVPCHLWIPKNAKKPCPAVICLQGHSTGMHISMGRSIYEKDEELIKGGDRDFAKQIVCEGYAALVIEQRAFGERKSPKVEGDCTCSHVAMSALLVGRTLLGERVWDVSRSIDALAHFEEIDIEKIGIMGNSGGGTASYYAACTDERIKIAMPSCAVCSFGKSIGIMRHCECNYLPKIAKYFDMGELACLIAPRPLIIVAGREDHGFLFDGVKSVYSVIEKIYKKAGGECQLVVGGGGHRFYAEDSWKVFKKMAKWQK